MKESLEESLAPESAPKVKQNIDSLFQKIKNKEPIKSSYYEIQQRCKDGSYIDLEININIIYGHNGQPKEIAGITRDITERKKAELALKESEEKYRLITENAKDIIWKMDIETLSYTYISPSITRLTGYTPKEILTLHLAELVPPDSLRKVKKLIQERLKLPANPESNICERFLIYSKDRKKLMLKSLQVLFATKAEMQPKF